jgi:cobalamin-dependent methionine synthase I
MPITDLLGAIARIQPDVICLSVVLIDHLKTLEVSVQEIRANHPQTPIIVGGGAFANGNLAAPALSQVPHVHIFQSIVQLNDFVVAYS